MPKQNGLGMNFYAGIYNVSGDINSLGTIGASVSLLDKTGIDKFGYERIQGLSTGTIEFVSHFNVDAGREHAAFKSLPYTDVILSAFVGTTLGNPAASMVAKQLNYDASRSDDGDIKFSLTGNSNGYGLEWGRMLTAGIRTDTAATNGSSIDTLASASFGGQAYLHVTAFSGTDVTIKIQDSANNSTWADVTSFTFGTITGTTSARIQLGATATVRQYLRAITTTSAGFTSVSFAINVVKNAATIGF